MREKTRRTEGAENRERRTNGGVEKEREYAYTEKV